MRIITNKINSIEIDNTQLENVTSFLYLGRVVNHIGGTEEDLFLTPTHTQIMV